MCSIGCTSLDRHEASSAEDSAATGRGLRGDRRTSNVFEDCGGGGGVGTCDKRKMLAELYKNRAWGSYLSYAITRIVVPSAALTSARSTMSLHRSLAVHILKSVYLQREAEAVWTEIETYLSLRHNLVECSIHCVRIGRQYELRGIKVELWRWYSCTGQVVMCMFQFQNSGTFTPDVELGARQIQSRATIFS